MNNTQQPAININMGGANKLKWTIVLGITMPIMGWIINSESVMPNLMDFYLRVRYGRRVAEQMKVRTPEQIKLDELEAKLEEERRERGIMEKNRLQQQAVIESMAKDSSAKVDAELRLAREREAEKTAELERLREVGRARQAAEAKAAEEKRYRESAEGLAAIRKAKQEEQRLADEKRNPDLITLRQMEEQEAQLDAKWRELGLLRNQCSGGEYEKIRVIGVAMDEVLAVLHPLRSKVRQFRAKVQLDEIRNRYQTDTAGFKPREVTPGANSL